MKLRRRRLLLPRPLPPLERIKQEMYSEVLYFVRSLPRRPAVVRSRPWRKSDKSIVFLARPLWEPAWSPWATHSSLVDPPEVARAKNEMFSRLLDNLALVERSPATEDAMQQANLTRDAFLRWEWKPDASEIKAQVVNLDDWRRKD